MVSLRSGTLLLLAVASLSHCGGRSKESGDMHEPSPPSGGAPLGAAGAPAADGGGLSAGGTSAIVAGSGAATGGGSCDAVTDIDCRQPAGSSCTTDEECETQLCSDGRCCAAPCEVCEECSGPGGTCIPVALREQDDSPAGACAGDSWCNGRGRCEPKAQIVAGWRATCVLLADGRVRCWPPIGGESLGEGETPDSLDDVEVGGVAVEVAVGSYYGCVLLAEGNLRCWGAGGFTGYGNWDSVSSPAEGGDVEVGGAVVQLASKYWHMCAVLANETVRCWGDNSSGRLGYPENEVPAVGFENVPSDVDPVDVGSPVADITAAQGHTCALLGDGNASCWGAYDGGRLGVPNPEAASPALMGNVAYVDANAIQLAAGLGHTCALLADGNVRCWGEDFSGQLGYPADSTGNVVIGGPVKAIACGYYHTCALLSGGAVRCWGAGQDGRLGYGNTQNIGDDETPASAGDVDLGGIAIGIAAGEAHSCALLADYSVRCWGRGTHGQLGYGHTENIGDDETPASVGAVPYR